jgi:hypothetical protein
MAALDPVVEELFIGIAHALFVNRLHVLRLTEIVRLGIRPDPHDQNMEVPKEIDADLIQQAFAYVVRHFPPTFAAKLETVRARWIRLA